MSRDAARSYVKGRCIYSIAIWRIDPLNNLCCILRCVIQRFSKIAVVLVVIPAIAAIQGLMWISWNMRQGMKGDKSWSWDEIEQAIWLEDTVSYRFKNSYGFCLAILKSPSHFYVQVFTFPPTFHEWSYNVLVAPRQQFIEMLNRNLNLQLFKVLFVTGNYSGILNRCITDSWSWRYGEAFTTFQLMTYWKRLTTVSLSLNKTPCYIKCPRNDWIHL